jgi:MFS superfamily sulfate permease-like transporter
MIERVFPFLGWLKGYNGDKFRADAIAGITVSLVLVPQSMAYAQLAGMPAYYGLYAAFLPPMLASLFGSSRQLATGPVAVVSLMTAASLEPLATAGSEGFIAYAIVLAFMVGLFQFALGVLRLGLIVNFLSHPVVNGFTNAAAIIIATSQLSKFFNVYVDSSEHHYQTILDVLNAAGHYTHWPSLAMGILAFGIMYGLKKAAPKVPNVLVAVAITTVLSWAVGFSKDVRAPLAAIQSPEVRALAEEFNATFDSKEKHAKERPALSAEFDKALESKVPLTMLQARYKLDVLNATITAEKEKEAEIREKLRGFLFRSETGQDGKPVFYLRVKGENAPGDDGRIWRVMVGNKKLDLEKLRMAGGGAVIGTIPKGLPAFGVPKLEASTMLKLLPFAVIISLLGFMEAISIAKAMAAKTGQRLDPNQELIGQGLANMLGALGQSYPTSGSFSRSAVNLQAGAVTGFSSVITSAAVVITLMFLTPVLYHLPEPVLAAVIMMAVIGLVNVSGFVHAWKAQWYDGVISVISFIATLAFAPHLDKGIMVGVTLSLGVFLYKSMRPKVHTLSRAGDSAFRSSVVHGLEQCLYVDMVRFDGPLFFANASYLEDQINDRLLKKKSLRHIVIVCNGINDMDASGEETLSLLVDRVRSAGLDISLSGVNEAVMEVLERTHLIEKIGRDRIFPTMERAVCSVHHDAHRNGEEAQCPLSNACALG